MYKNLKPVHIIILAALLFFVLLPWKNISSSLRYEWMNKSNLHLHLSLINPQVHVVSADPENKLLLRVEVRDAKGTPVPMAEVQLLSDRGMGSIAPKAARTDNQGEFLVTYSPPNYDNKFFSKGNIDITLRAIIPKSGREEAISFKLAPLPAILIHGYQADESVFGNLKEYLSERGYQSTALKFSSEEGVLQGEGKLSNLLNAQKMLYLSQGFQVKRFDLIAHSLGGLVARAYTCSDQYISNNDVRKIIFISVPQKGSPLASVGLSYFHDQGIQDLVPDSDLLMKTLPSMINKGLNAAIQVGSIMGQHDEVVSPESASLEEWNIHTEVFDIGDKTINVNTLLSGNFSEDTNHMAILSNKKVFEKINDMLASNLPYPKTRSK